VILKAYRIPAIYRLTILSILLLFIGSGCGLTRRLKGNESLVRKVTIKGMDKEFTELALNYVDKQQQPNNVINLQLYYLFNKNGKRSIGEPRGPKTELRLSPQQTIEAVESSGLMLIHVIDLPPYHYAAVFERLAS